MKSSHSYQKWKLLYIFITSAHTHKSRMNNDCAAVLNALEEEEKTNEMYMYACSPHVFVEVVI